uniref:endopeptidase La n=1 Tax=Candidatus Electronema sp. TaxID=2698783 RepID=UPI004056920F
MSEFNLVRYPVMPLRDIVLFPGMVAPLVIGRKNAPLVIGRKNSVRALEHAMEQRSLIFLVAQKEAGVDDPQAADLRRCGVLATVIQLLRLPDGTMKALVEGKRRAVVAAYIEFSDFLRADLSERPDTEAEHPDLPAYSRELRRTFAEYIKISRQKIPAEIVKVAAVMENPARLVDLLCAHVQLPAAEKQELLETVALPDRLRRLIELLYREIELDGLEKSIETKVRKRLADNQRNYYLGEKVKEIQQEMGHVPDDHSELQAALEKKELPESAREKAMKELNKLKAMPPMSAESTVVRNYLDTIISLPWREKSEAKIDIEEAERILDQDHHGLKKAKERILEYLAVQAQVEKIRGPIICLVGPPGVGKTSICKSIAKAMNRKFVRLSLGGVRDEAEIRGHRRTYIGAMPGKIIHAMQRAEVINPVFCLDEVDKMSVDFRGDPSSALLEVLDPEQNSAFNDHYLDLDYDLSEVFFIATANSLHSIPLPLQDRMEIIRLSGYTEEEKLRIAQEYLAPKQLERNGFAADDIVFEEEAVLEIVRRYTREAGVRDLERTIASICRKVARDRLQKKEPERKYQLGSAAVSEYLGVPKHRYGMAEKQDETGLVTGLAWTEVGGELLQIETALMPGTGKLTVTGKLGEVMQESAQAAMACVRARAGRLGLDPGFYQKLDIHVHVPEGAIPKDGPSAGITMATSIVSALLKVPVDRQLAMTGEITLRGRVLPIGGLTEKLLAAKRGGISRVILPKENERDLEDVPAKVRASLDIALVEHVDEVFSRALLLREGEELFHDAPLDAVIPPALITVPAVPAQRN